MSSEFLIGLITGSLIMLLLGYINMATYIKHLEQQAKRGVAEFIRNKPYYILSERDYLDMLRTYINRKDVNDD